MVSRREILTELEKELSCPVAAIVYHDKYEISNGDEKYVSAFFSEFKTNNVALILHGTGGYPPSALEMAILLRKKFKKIISLVPERAASAMSYIWLISNKAYFCSDTVATQVNISFNPGTGWVLPKNNLNHPNQLIQEAAKTYFKCDYSILENILLMKDSILGGELPKDARDRSLFIENLFESTHKKDCHTYPLTIRKLQDFHFNVERPNTRITNLLSEYVDSAKADILANQKRSLFETKRESIATFPTDADFR